MALHTPLLWGEGLGVRLHAQYRVTHLEKPLNTPGSETGALQLGDTVLVFSSMPPTVSTNKQFDVSGSVMQVYQARIAKNGRVARPKSDRWGLNSRRDHTGNIAFDPWTKDIYFTRGDVETLNCEIYFSKRKKRRGWEKPVPLRGPVNSKQHTATQPAVGRLPGGEVILYFVSDRPGGMGGRDIWQCIVADGVAGEPVNLGPQVNSRHDECTPFYDQTNGVLYFSSDRPGGQGGFDIYCATGQRNTWQPAEAVCGCLNSPQNDLYFVVCSHDTLTGIPTDGYLSSNRRDSFFLNDSMCCNDIYRWHIDTAALLAMQQPPQPDTPSAAPSAPALPDRFFPLYLYFHNDDPDPRSTDTTTQADYADCQLRYALLHNQYMRHQRTTADSAAMQRFFDSCVVGNFERVNTLLDYVDEALSAGKTVELTVAGYASPLSTEDYNYRLSQRRIASFRNMVRAWQEGRLAGALADGRLKIVQVPRGAEAATDESRASDAVYSLPAAKARRIEVASCKIQ